MQVYGILKKKNRIDESIYRLGMEEQMQKMDLLTQGGEGWGTNWNRSIEIYTTVCNIDS